MTPPVSPHALPRRLYKAFTKGAGLYPIKGIYYFITHPYLYPLLRSRLVPAALLSLFILSLLFFFTYLIQVGFLALWQGRSAWFNATVLVLAEGEAITALVFEAFFVDECQVAAFDAVLLARGHDALVKNGRAVLPPTSDLTTADDEAPEGETLDPLQRLGKPHGKAEFAPFSLRQILELILLLPVMFIPWVGAPLFMIGTGYRAGPLLMWRYYRLRGMGRRERKAWIRKRRWAYTWFGTVHLLLQLVPVLNMFFMLCTGAGAGLLAAEEERMNGEREAEGEARDSVDEGEVPPAYHDDPV